MSDATATMVGIGVSGAVVAVAWLVGWRLARGLDVEPERKRGER